jgi:hypothetical protein
MAGLPANVTAGRNVDPQTYREIIQTFASNGNYLQTAKAFGLHDEQVRRIIKSPQGSFALEQTLRERARTRALRLGATTDRLIDELDAILDRGDERILNGRRDGDPLTVFLRPGLRDVVSGLAWSTHHMREISETLSAIDVTAHDVSHESRSQNLTTLKELVALEERRLALDNERQAADDSAPPVVDTFASTPYSRNSWGGNRSIDPQRQSHRTHKDRLPEALAAKAQQDIASARAAEAGVGASLPSPRDAGTGLPGITAPDAGSMSAPDTAETHSSMSAADTPSRDRPPTPAQAREAAPETFLPAGDSRGSRISGATASNEVTWEDLEEE